MLTSAFFASTTPSRRPRYTARDSARHPITSSKLRYEEPHTGRLRLSLNVGLRSDAAVKLYPQGQHIRM
jgi:hypothetical protein